MNVENKMNGSNDVDSNSNSSAVLARSLTQQVMTGHPSLLLQSAKMETGNAQQRLSNQIQQCVGSPYFLTNQSKLQLIILFFYLRLILIWLISYFLYFLDSESSSGDLVHFANIPEDIIIQVTSARAVKKEFKGTCSYGFLVEGRIIAQGQFLQSDKAKSFEDKDFYIGKKSRPFWAASGEKKTFGIMKDQGMRIVTIADEDSQSKCFLDYGRTEKGDGINARGKYIEFSFLFVIFPWK